MKRSIPRAASGFFLAPLLLAVLLGTWWQWHRFAPAGTWAATALGTPKNFIPVPIGPQLSADGRLIAVGIQLLERVDYTNDDGNKDYFDKMVGFEVRFWDAQTLSPLPSIPLASTPGQMMLSPDGSLLAITESGIGLRVIDLASKKTLWSRSEAESAHIIEEPGMTTILAPHGLSFPVFTPDGRTLAAWSVFIDADKGITQVTGCLIDARTGAQKASWKGAPGSWLNDRTLAFSPAGHDLVSDELQPRIYTANVPFARPEIRCASDGKLLRTLPFNHARVVAFGAENRLLILINSDQYGTDAVEVNTKTGQRIWSHTGTVKEGQGPLLTSDSAFYSMDKEWVALCFRGSQTVEILDAKNGKLVRLLQVPTAPSAPYTQDGAFSFSPDGKAILAVSGGTIVKLAIDPPLKN